MNLMGDILKKIIDKYNIKIYQLAKKSKVDRTTIHKIISSNRVIPKNQFTTILDLLPITLSEKDALLKAYEISSIGELQYNEKLQVLKILERMGELNDVWTSNIINSKIIKNTKILPNMFLGQISINNLIDKFINNTIVNKLSLKIFVSKNYSFFYQILIEKFSTNYDLEVISLIEFVNNIEHSNFNENLDTLHTILPLIVSPNRNFYIYYQYTNFNSFSFISFNNYLFTDEGIIILSSDLKTAYFTDDKNIIESYKKVFENNLKNSKQLIKRIASLEENIVYFCELMENNELSPIKCFEPQPCLSNYYSNVFFKKYLKDKFNNDYVIKLTMRYVDNLKKIFSDGIFLFTIKGLHDFAYEGIIQYLPETYINKIDKNDRINLLKLLLHDVNNKKCVVRLVNQDVFKTSNFIALNVFSNRYVNISSNNIHQPFNSDVVIIEDFTIVEAFNRFFENILDSNYLFSENDTLSIINTCINDLESIDTSV